MQFDTRVFQELLSNTNKEEFISQLNKSYISTGIDISSALEGKGSSSYAPYIIFDTYSVSSEFVEHLRKTGENAWRVMTACGHILHTSNTEVIAEWGYPEDYVSQMLSNTEYPPEMRFDIAVNPEALKNNELSLSYFKVLEVNSATPSFWWETFIGNKAICDYFDKACPNKGLGELHMRSILTDAYNHPAYSVREPWYFSIPFLEAERNQFSEDALNMDARMGFLNRLGVETRFRYIEDLIFETDVAQNECLKDGQTGNVIKNLFLHYPSEWLIDEQGELFADDLVATTDTVRPWDYLNSLVLSNQICKLPPIMGDTIQNKSLLAFAWEAALEYRFDSVIHDLITTHFLPTFCFQDQAEALEDYWEKPVYGREGAGIKRFVNGAETFSSWMPESEIELNDYYQSMQAIYQQHSPLPQIKFADSTLTLMFTVYVGADGIATGIGLRASAESDCISAYNGLWYPLSLKD